MRHVRSVVDEDGLIRRAAHQLGFAGVIPFWALIVLALGGDLQAPGVAEAMALWIAFYGAVIVSFMGGSRWVLCLRKPEVGPMALFGGLLGAVGPPLVAWAVIAPPGVLPGWDPDPLTRLFVIALLLLVQLLQDWSHHRRGGVEDWYMKLRVMLTAGATTPIFAALILSSAV